LQVWNARSLQGIIYSLCMSWGAHSLPVGRTRCKKLKKKITFNCSGFSGSTLTGTGCLLWWSSTSPSTCCIRPTWLFRSWKWVYGFLLMVFSWLPTWCLFVLRIYRGWMSTNGPGWSPFLPWSNWVLPWWIPLILMDLSPTKSWLAR
jgi:hypothetical protein